MLVSFSKEKCDTKAVIILADTFEKSAIKLPNTILASKLIVQLLIIPQLITFITLSTESTNFFNITIINFVVLA